SQASPAPNEEQARIDAFFTAVTDRWVESNPDQAISTGYFSGAKQNALERQLTPRTRDYELQRNAMAREVLTGLAAQDFSQATPTQRFAGELLKWQLDTLLTAEPFLDYIGLPLNQFDGANVGLPNALTVVHPVQDAQDADTYVARLKLVDDRLREAIADSAGRAQRGVVMPAFILRTTIAQMQQFIAPAPTDNPLVTTLAAKTEALGDLTPEQRSVLLQSAATIVADEIYPAWTEAIAELSRQLPMANDDAGLWRFPNGAEIYRRQIRAFTTTDLTPEQIHEIGLQEVARLEAEMDGLFRQIGLVDGSILERIEQLETRTAYSHDDAGREALTQDVQRYLADALQRSAALFDKMPQSSVIAQPYPRFRWETAAAGYTTAPLDGSRPAVFQFPLRDNELMRYEKRSLVYHETVPGHHFQLALIAENKELPRFMQIRAFGGNSAITEGWALYAERLAAESNWYDGDIEGRLGYLDSALFRARRLVVDTGLHAMRWTRQQAIDYGIPPSEVDRYVVNPGQACAYMLGQLKIVELREKARAALGDRFSIREFHNVVLGAGIAPLTMLQQVVDDYVASKG
ncbi:MAG TPA: DUF885 domain-containing protein, partial [Gammaproteobacteria bacterium]|nr:DUF885 domain-containing protein [Gammaproteobacteria bacterium]